MPGWPESAGTIEVSDTDAETPLQAGWVRADTGGLAN